MRLSMPMGRALLGFGLAATVLLGCEKFVEEQGDAGKTEEGAPENLALQLSVKPTEECRDLRDVVMAARQAGNPTEQAEKAFLAKCVEEVEPRSDGKVILPPQHLEIDDFSRCRWIVSQIEGGRDELTVKFRYYCPDDCDTLAAVDSVRHFKLCRDSRPDCEHLTSKLSRLDSNSEEYHRLARYLGETCWNIPDKPNHLDSLRHCDTLRMQLARAEINSPRHDSLTAELRVRCGFVVPPVTPCDSLLTLLVRSNLSQEGVLRLKHQIDSLCGRPVIDSFHFCDSLRLGLVRIDSTTPGGDSLLLDLRHRCGYIPPPITPCDSLLRVMAVTMYTPEGWENVNRQLRQLCGSGIDTVSPPPFPPRVTCDSLLKEWTRLDPSSPVHDSSKALYHGACVDTLLPRNVCDDLKKRMPPADSTSRQSVGLREIYHQRCVGTKND